VRSHGGRRASDGSEVPRILDLVEQDEERSAAGRRPAAPPRPRSREARSRPRRPGCGSPRGTSRVSACGGMCWTGMPASRATLAISETRPSCLASERKTRDTARVRARSASRTGWMPARISRSRAPSVAELAATRFPIGPPRTPRTSRGAPCPFPIARLAGAGASPIPAIALPRVRRRTRRPPVARAARFPAHGRGSASPVPPRFRPRARAGCALRDPRCPAPAEAPRRDRRSEGASPDRDPTLRRHRRAQRMEERSSLEAGRRLRGVDEARDRSGATPPADSKSAAKTSSTLRPALAQRTGRHRARRRPVEQEAAARREPDRTATGSSTGDPRDPSARRRGPPPRAPAPGGVPPSIRPARGERRRPDGRARPDPSP
jgi:hypothetical protein